MAIDNFLIIFHRALERLSRGTHFSWAMIDACAWWKERERKGWWTHTHTRHGDVYGCKAIISLISTHFSIDMRHQIDYTHPNYWNTAFEREKLTIISSPHDQLNFFSLSIPPSFSSWCFHSRAELTNFFSMCLHENDYNFVNCMCVLSISLFLHLSLSWPWNNLILTAAA